MEGVVVVVMMMVVVAVAKGSVHWPGLYEDLQQPPEGADASLAGMGEAVVMVVVMVVVALVWC